jgi:hypothetical protein
MTPGRKGGRRRRAETEAKARWAEAAGWRAAEAETEATWAEVDWA